MNTIIGLYDAGYRLINDNPVLFLFTRDHQRNKKVITITDFKPYLYVNSNDRVPPYVSDIEPVQTKTLRGQTVTRCVLRKPSDVYRIKNVTDQQTYESDVLFENRYLIDRVDKIERSTYRTIYFDIETDSEHGFPDALNPIEPICSISAVDSFSKKPITFVWRKDLVPQQQQHVIVFNNELDMINAFVDWWARTEPDIVCAWNVRFDIGYLIARMNALDIQYERLSPVHNVTFDTIIVDRQQINEDGTVTIIKQQYNKHVQVRQKGEIEIFGVVIVDLLRAYRKLHFGELTSFSLNRVAMEELNAQKLPVHNVGQMWRSNWKKMVQYNALDVDLMMRIDQKCKLLSILEDMKNFAVVKNVNECFFASRIHESKIMRAYKDRVVFDNKPLYQDKTVETSITGAFVKEPIAGVYDNVVVLDFKSLYPNIIYSFNLSKEMIVDDDTVADVFDINGVKFRRTPKGIMPSMIEELVQLKEDMKKVVVGTGQDVADKMFAIKTFINSFYGVNALSSFRLYDQRVAQSITSIGQILIKEISDYIEQQIGFPVIYNDTDSVFVQIHTGTMIEQASVIEQRVNAHVVQFIRDRYGIDGKSLKVEFEKAFDKILLNTKKRYAGLMVWDGQSCNKIKIAGMGARRSDVSSFARSLQRNVLEQILRGAKHHDVINFVRDEVDRMISGDVSFDDVGIPEKLNRPVDQYLVPNSPKLIAVAFSNQQWNMSINAGTKFKVLYVKHTRTHVVAFEDDDQLRDKQVVVDWPLMVEKNVWQKLDDIFRIVGWQTSYDELKGEVSRQFVGQSTLNDFGVAHQRFVHRLSQQQRQSNDVQITLTEEGGEGHG